MEFTVTVLELRTSGFKGFLSLGFGFRGFWGRDATEEYGKRSPYQGPQNPGFHLLLMLGSGCRLGLSDFYTQTLTSFQGMRIGEWLSVWQFV